MKSDIIYLDHAAATPMDDRVLAAMQPYFTERFFNASATYLAAQQVSKDLQAARAGIADLLGVRPVEITFTAGGTEANNLAIHGIMQQFSDGNMVMSSIEHDSVLEPGHQYANRKVAVTTDGIVDIDDLEASIDDHTVLVSIMYANNEVGTIEPIRDIGQRIAQIRQNRKKAGNSLPLYFHTDACQAGAYLDLHVSRLGVDLLTLNGGKIYGPKQSGILYARSGTTLRPQILGGGQERGVRSGTENVANFVGLATALNLVQQNRNEEVKRLQELQLLFFRLLEAHIPTAVINGSRRKRLPNNVHITFPGIDNERLLFQLDEAGILAAAGSACSASSDEPSHVLTALGLSDVDAQSSLRFSMGQRTTAAMIEHTVQTLAKFVN